MNKILLGFALLALAIGRVHAQQQVELVVPKLDLVIAAYGGNYADRVSLNCSRNTCRASSCRQCARAATIRIFP
jgi:hypothetical protein